MTVYPSLHPWTHVGVYCLFLIPMHSHESTHKYCVYSFITTFFFLFFVRSIASYYGYYLVVQSWLYNNRLNWILNSFLAENVSATCNILAESCFLLMSLRMSGSLSKAATMHFFQTFIPRKCIEEAEKLATWRIRRLVVGEWSSEIKSVLALHNQH